MSTSFEVIFSSTVPPIAEGEVSFALAAALACEHTWGGLWRV